MNNLFWKNNIGKDSKYSTHPFISFSKLFEEQQKRVVFFEEGKKGRRIYDLRSNSKIGDSDFQNYSTNFSNHKSVFPFSLLQKKLQLLGFVFLLSLFFSNKTVAQVLPPDFLCVRSDTLIWNIPTNPCGSFNAYEIYFSDMPNGPFNLLATVTNPGQNIYHHPNPTGNTWYYYMQSDFNCVGEPILQSDTLDNQQPEIAIINKASANGNSIELEWTASPSPETSGYIVFRNTSLGTIPLDTIYNGTTYVDNNASPNTQPETYFILALDECGNTSIFNTPHTTVFLTQTVAGCDQEINLSWNRYEGWTNGIGSQEVWFSLDGNMPTLIATLSATDSTYTFENATDLQDHCFYIRSIEAGTGIDALSNEICLVPDLVNAMRDLILRNVNVLPDNSVELTWSWNSNAEIQSVEILNSNANGGYSILDSSPAPMPLGNASSFIDVVSDPVSGKVFYQIQTTDDCDTLVFSNYGSTIHLTGSPQPGSSNFLTWTDFDIENAMVTDYDIYRIVDGSISFVKNVPAGTTTFSDPVDGSNESESNVCYYVVANAEVMLPNGGIEMIESTSNIACIEQLTSIIAPNAFAPQGRNQIFKPFVIFGETVDYQLTIYNRWGELLFETKDIDQGWNGKYKGKIQPMGAYVFHVRIIQQSGREIEEHGVFTLLR